MFRRPHAALVIVAVLAGLASARLPAARAQPGAPGELIFDVRVTLAADPAQRRPPCMPAELERPTFQFRIAPDDEGASLWVSAGDLKRPSFVESSPARLGGDSDGYLIESSPTGQAGLTLDNARYIFNAGRITLRDDDGDGRPDHLAVSDLRGEYRRLDGDVIRQCSFAGSAEGDIDRTPPAALFDAGCRSRPCTLLRDSPIVIGLSEPGDVDRLWEALAVADGEGNPIRIEHVVGSGTTYPVLWLTGAWPLGGQVTVTVPAGGARDRAGNESEESFSQTYDVVADPGPLADGGFESGDFAGFTVLPLRDYLHQIPGTGVDPALFVAGGDLPADVVESFLGIAPTEGRFMARLGGTMSCSPGEMALTARITPPAGATRLLLDYNVLGRTARLNWGGGGREFPPIVARLEVPRGLVELTLGRPAVTELTTELEGGFGATGWRTLRMEVHSAPGEAILTLRARPSFVGPPPPLCVPGVLLLDNLRFE